VAGALKPSACHSGNPAPSAQMFIAPATAWRPDGSNAREGSPVRTSSRRSKAVGL